MVRRFMRILPSLTAGLLLLSPGSAKSDITPYHLNDVQYHWPANYPEADFSLQTTFTVWDDPNNGTYLYFSHFVSLGPYTGDANDVTLYFGLQTTGGTGRAAIFSLWNATDGNGPGCTVFGNEGVGWHCLVDYPWVAGRSYVMTVSRRTGSPNDVYTGSISDRTTGNVTALGTLTGPHSDLRPGVSIFFYEYYGSISSCSALPDVSMTFSSIQGERGTVLPTYDPGAYGYESMCSDNIETTICDNTIYNVGGGSVARPAGMTAYGVGNTCRAPQSPAVGASPSPSPTPSPSPSPTPSPAPSPSSTSSAQPSPTPTHPGVQGSDSDGTGGCNAGAAALPPVLAALASVIWWHRRKAR